VLPQCGDNVRQIPGRMQPGGNAKDTLHYSNHNGEVVNNKKKAINCSTFSKQREACMKLISRQLHAL